MIGNLKMYLGPADLDHYAEFLRELLVPIAPANRRGLWILRIGLLRRRRVLHIHAAYSLTVMNRRARSVKYESGAPTTRLPTSPAARCAGRGSSWLLFVALAPRRLHVGLGQSRLRARRRLSQCRCHRCCTSCRSRSCTSSPTLPSASTCTTGHGACFSRWAGIDRGSTSGGVVLPIGFATLDRCWKRVVPDCRPRRNCEGLRCRSHSSQPKFDGRVPAGPIEEKWDAYKDDVKLVNPNNKRKFKIIVVGTGLAGASAAATLAELGYKVEAFRITIRLGVLTRSLRRVASTPPRTITTTATSVHRFFYDT